MPADDVDAARAAKLLKDRQDALLARWSAGKRLKPEELAEIADVLPRPPAPPPLLQLEAQVEGAVDRKYQEGREAYAARYGQSIRTINRWMKKNAPLDRPAEMPAWWSATMKHRVPAEILAAAAGETISAVLETNAPVGGTARPPGETMGAFSETPAVIPLTALEQARAVANEAYAKLQRMLAWDDAGAIALAQRSYQQASEQLRRMELADPKIRALAGKTIDREKLRAILTDMHTSIAQTWRTFSKRMRGELRGKTAAEQETTWQEETDKIFARFRNGEFADLISI